MRNPQGASTAGVSKEWGRKNRKEEARQRGLNRSAARAAIAEGTAELQEGP